MSEKTSATNAQNAEENVAKKTDARAIPMAGVALFVLVAIAFGIFSFFRNRNVPANSPAAVQNAPLANPSAQDSGG